MLFTEDWCYELIISLELEMNIYKKENQILVSLNGCPEGWQNLGFDPTLAPEDIPFVNGFNAGKATLDENAKNEFLSKAREQISLKLKNEILEYFDVQSNLGVLFKTKHFQAREMDISRMSLQVSKLSIGGSFGGAWRDVSNDWVILTEAEFKELALLAGNYWETCFRKSRTLIDSLPSKNIAQLANYDIHVEWNEID
jgi:hypothetical protein